MKKLTYLMGASLVALTLTSQAHDFSGHLFGIRAGGSMPFGTHEAKADILTRVVTDKVSITGPQGLAGINYTWNMGDTMMHGVDMGLTLGADWFFGDAYTRINTPTPTAYHSVAQKTRYEFSLSVGKQQGGLYPYLKAGAVAGDWATRSRTGTGSVDKKELFWGATVGAGLDYGIHNGGSMGFVAEVDWYSGKKYNMTLATGAAPFAKMEVNPLSANLAVNYKYKIA